MTNRELINYLIEQPLDSEIGIMISMDGEKMSSNNIVEFTSSSNGMLIIKCEE